MSKSCTIVNCKRVSRALCHCCQQNLCIIHLNEHNDLLNSQLNPLTDEINTLGERLKTLNIDDVLLDCRQKLETWRSDCHKKIDHFVDEKLQELDLLVAKKFDGQQKVITHIRSELAKLIQDQAATQEDIDTLTSTIRRLEKEINKIEQLRLTVESRPLLVDDAIVQVKEICEKEFDLSMCSSIYQTIAYPSDSAHSLASNNRLLLIHQKPNLCFINAELTIIKQVLWSHDKIVGMSWSSTLDRFIVIVKDNIYLVDENSTSIESVETVKKRNVLSCTCFNDQLFLSTNELGSSIVEVSLSPSIAVIKEWISPKSCMMDELIHDIIYNNGTLAVMIRNTVQNSVHMELRSYTTLDRLWSLALDIVPNALAFRCCSLSCNEWIVVDHNAGRLLHISADGKMKKAVAYTGSPYRATLFGSNMLAISRINSGINFHKI